MLDRSTRLPLINVASLLWGVILLCAVFMARPIYDAWFHDSTLRFAFPVFILWLLATLLQWRRFPESWPLFKTLFVVLASVLLCLGIGGELQAFIYLAAAILCVLPIHGGPIKCLFFMVLSCLWMPALTWLFFPYFGTALPWMTLFIALFLLVYSLSDRFLRYASETRHSSL
jgi:hypothetical protein